MLLQVTKIEFDFTGAEDEISEQEMKNITEETIGRIIEADDEKDLMEQITSWTGWRIDSINYLHILT